MDCYQVAQRYIRMVTKELATNDTNILTVMEKIGTPTALSTNSYIAFEQFGDFQVGVSIGCNPENSNVAYVTVEVNDNPDSFVRLSSHNENVYRAPNYTTDWSEQDFVVWEDGKFSTVYR